MFCCLSWSYWVRLESSYTSNFLPRVFSFYIVSSINTYYLNNFHISLLVSLWSGGHLFVFWILLGSFGWCKCVCVFYVSVLLLFFTTFTSCYIFMIRNRVSESILMAELCFCFFVHFGCVPTYIYIYLYLSIYIIYQSIYIIDLSIYIYLSIHLKLYAIIKEVISKWLPLLQNLWPILFIE